MRAKKTEVLGALAVGCAAGWAICMAAMSSGCFAAWMAVARADDVTTVECTMSGQKVEFALPDTNPETFARLSVVRADTDCAGVPQLSLQKDVVAKDGKVTFDCPDSNCQGMKGHPHGVFTFVLR